MSLVLRVRKMAKRVIIAYDRACLHVKALFTQELIATQALVLRIHNGLYVERDLEASLAPFEALDDLWLGNWRLAILCQALQMLYLTLAYSVIGLTVVAPEHLLATLPQGIVWVNQYQILTFLPGGGRPKPWVTVVMRYCW